MLEILLPAMKPIIDKKLPKLEEDIKAFLREQNPEQSQDFGFFVTLNPDNNEIIALPVNVDDNNIMTQQEVEIKGKTHKIFKLKELVFSLLNKKV